MTTELPQHLHQTSHSFIEERKLKERVAYDASYSQGGEFTDSEVKDRILLESENLFCELIKLYSRNARVLEIGCGLGFHSIYSAKNGAKFVIGVDISEEGIRVARENASRENLLEIVKFEVADIEDLPYLDDSFDLIINHEVFSSIDTLKVLPELRRVLRKGGHLISIECLGHNPIFNWNRQRNLKTGKRTQWAVDHIFSDKDLKFATSIFNQVSFKSFHFSSVLLAPILLRLPVKVGNFFIKITSKLDRFILKLPQFKLLAFKSVMDWE